MTQRGILAAPTMTAQNPVQDAFEIWKKALEDGTQAWVRALGQPPSPQAPPGGPGFQPVLAAHPRPGHGDLAEGGRAGRGEPGVRPAVEGVPGPVDRGLVEGARPGDGDRGVRPGPRPIPRPDPHGAGPAQEGHGAVHGPGAPHPRAPVPQPGRRRRVPVGRPGRAHRGAGGSAGRDQAAPAWTERRVAPAERRALRLERRAGRRARRPVLGRRPTRPSSRAQEAR